MPNTREKLIERLPIDDAIRIFREELKHRSEAYTTHLSYGGKGDPAEEVYIDALAMAASALEQTKWIPVTERLPDCADTVLAVDRDGIIASAYYAGNWHSGGELDEYAITHWMPLPEAPKGE